MTGKIKRRVIIGGLLMLLSAILVCVYFALQPIGRHDGAKIDISEVIPYLQDGDIICRLGDRLWSLYIRNTSETDRRFSHVGIVRIRDGQITVINAECLVSDREERVNEVTLEQFLEVARSIGVYRANFLDGPTISDGAMKYLNLPFDWKFDLSDTTTVYCTELIHRVILDHASKKYALETVRVTGLGKSVIPLEAISNSVNFDEVLYIDLR
ncbi:MAG: hypothetical protein LBU70_09985 [Chitinispirillales bacterium]|jgi:hypothetical protein|nr:hypothetical protein [Chitinispirillales bacterium]